MISLIVTCDSRPMSDAEVFTVGDNGGTGSLQGCRSWDFLTDGAEQKLNFFRGYPVQLIIAVDVHEPIPQDVMTRMQQLIDKAANGSKIVCSQADHSHPRWYDKIQLDSIRHATGDFVAKFDQDANAMCCFPCEVVDEFIQVLNNKLATFVCQPSDMHPSAHGMYWASTRFFMCKRETLHFDALDKAIENPSSIFEKYAWEGSKHLPCLEHILGVMGNIGGKPGVIYPPLQPHRWLVFSWARYCRGVLAKLNAMSYEEASNIIVNRFGLCGPMDCLCQPLP